MIRRRSDRRGYALILVVVFVVLFTALLGVAWRRVASALRVENACDVRCLGDNCSLQGLADAMNTLESRLTWDATHSTFTLVGQMPYTIQCNGKYCQVSIVPTDGCPGGTQWTVSVQVVNP